MESRTITKQKLLLKFIEFNSNGETCSVNKSICSKIVSRARNQIVIAAPAASGFVVVGLAFALFTGAPLKRPVLQRAIHVTRSRCQFVGTLYGSAVRELILSTGSATFVDKKQACVSPNLIRYRATTVPKHNRRRYTSFPHSFPISSRHLFFSGAAMTFRSLFRLKNEIARLFVDYRVGGNIDEISSTS